MVVLQQRYAREKIATNTNIRMASLLAKNKANLTRRRERIWRSYGQQAAAQRTFRDLSKVEDIKVPAIDLGAERCEQRVIAMHTTVARQSTCEHIRTHAHAHGAEVEADTSSQMTTTTTTTTTTTKKKEHSAK